MAYKCIYNPEEIAEICKELGIEITPQVIEAGLEVVEESGRLWHDSLSSGDSLLVQELFVAMYRHLPSAKQ